MRIAFVLDAFSMGGIEVVAKNYIQLLNKAGHNIDVYVLHKSEIAMKDQLPSKVQFFSLNFDRKICPELYSYGVQKWWWGKYAYCIIHPFLTILLELKKMFFKKRTYDVAIAFSGHINDLTFVEKNFIKASKKICWCHGTLLSYLAICDGYSKLYKSFDTIITLSEQGLFSVYAGHEFLYNKKIINIYNPILIDEKKIDYDHVENLKKLYGDYILMIARATDQKDHKTAIDALFELHKRGLTKHIVFLGDGSKLIEYKEYAHRFKLDKWCHFEGTRFDVVDYIKASHINLLTSNWEGLPTVIIEAMALGKPCVMTNSDGGEATAFGKYGLLVPLKDSYSVADAIEKLYTNENEYEKYSALSRERYRDFSPDKIISKFEDVLES